MTKAGWIAQAVIALAITGDTRAEKVALVSPSVSVEQRTRTDGVNYYLVQINLPADVSSIRYAWLELRVDTSSDRIDGFADPVPLFEAYALNRSLTSDPTTDFFEPTLVPMSRPVPVGADRLVKIDVTEFVRNVAVNPSSNYGLVVGAVTPVGRRAIVVRSGGEDSRLVIIE
jgi:hypothetical protein